MKIFSSLILSAALIFATASTASAYSFSPPDVAARLKGTLTFTPNEGGTPFTCKVILDLKTKTREIKTIKFPSGNCEALTFQNMPWGVAILSANSGEFGNVGFASGNGNCNQLYIHFQDNSKGVWTLPAGQCLSGTLKSTPPVTIVP